MNKEELMQKFIALKLEQKLALTAGIIVLVVAAYYTMSYQGKQAQIEALEAEQQKLEQSLVEKQAIANNLQKFRIEVERLNTELREALLLLPNKSDIPELLSRIAELVEKSGLEMVEFELEDEQPRQFYAEVPINMEVKGSYHEVAVFFDKLAVLPRIIKVSNLAMTKPEEKNQKVYVEASFNATTYRFLGDATQPAK